MERVREVGRGGEESEAEKTFTAHTHICCVIGTGVDDDILRNAGIEKAEAFAAVTDSDYINIMAALIAKEIYHVHKVIAGIVNPRRLKITQELGLEAICPLTLGAQHIFDALVKK
ncbi:MAG: TrkA family potassium uptake protein [candidate division NC10 bacterium]|nr:TrkA family potassium uptake protein [candidate division NC10 bacterium]